MTDQSAPITLFQLDYIAEMTLTPLQTQILNMLSHSMQTDTPYPDMETATMLDDGCPPTDAAEDVMEEYLWNIWNLMVQIAISPNSTDHMQQCLVRVIQCLGTIAKGQVTIYGVEYRLWGDLPMFAMEMDAADSDPMLEMENFDTEKANIWIKESAFAARCFGAGLGVVYIQAIVALSSALEQEQTDGQAAAECRVEVACGWIVHAAATILRWAQDNIGRQVTEDDEEAYIENGPLYNGPPAVCLQRWGFWLDRFEAIGNGQLDIRKDLQEAAAEAAKTMKASEAKIANTL